MSASSQPIPVLWCGPSLVLYRKLCNLKTCVCVFEISSALNPLKLLLFIFARPRPVVSKRTSASNTKTTLTFKKKTGNWTKEKQTDYIISTKNAYLDCKNILNLIVQNILYRKEPFNSEKHCSISLKRIVLTLYISIYNFVHKKMKINDST